MAYVGILGGTFDPIHYGHLAAAEGALHLLGLDRVYFMPNRQPPHREGQAVTAAEHRAAMVRLAIEGNARFGYLGLELERDGPSYTIDTVQALQERHPDWQMALIVGMDNLLQIKRWRAYERLLTLVELVVVSRPGYRLEGAGGGEQVAGPEALEAFLGPVLARRVRLLEIPGVAVSSTALRRLALQGYPLRYLVPEPVERYILEHRLYR